MHSAGVPRLLFRHLPKHNYRRFSSASGSPQQKPEPKSPTLKTEWLLDGRVAKLVMADRGHMNTLSLGMMNQLYDHLQQLDTRQEVRAVIIASETAAFSTGHDLKELTEEAGTVQHRKVFSKCMELMELIPRMQLPVIAQVDGIVAAAGTQLVASCDIAIATGRCFFSVPGLKLGLFCSTPSIPLVRNIPRKIAMDMLLTGRSIDAPTALRYGLVSRTVAAEHLHRETLAMAEQICAMSRSVTALGKAFVYAQLEQNTHTAYRQGSAVMCENLKMRDTQEGISAFLNKRKDIQWTHTDEKVIKE